MGFANPFKTAKGRGNELFFPDEEATQSDLPLWQRNQLMEQLGESSSNAASKLFGALNYGGGIVRDVLTGNELGSGTSEGEFLENFGLRPSEDALGGFGRPIAEFVAGAATDPLNLVTFGGGTASRASQAARAAGLGGDDLIRHAGRRLVEDVASGARNIDNLGDLGYARNARDAMARNFRNKANIDSWVDDDLISRPLVGRGTAARSTTLRELVENAADPTAAARHVDNFLGKNYGQRYLDQADNLVGGDIGLNLPKFLGGPMSTTLPGGRLTTAALDRTGQAIRWSAPGRYAHSLFDTNVLGTVDEGDQMLARSWSRGDDVAARRARSATATLMRELAERAPTLFTDKNVDTAFRAVLEGQADAAQRQLVSQSGLDPFVQRWRQTRTNYIDRSRVAGVSSGELNDPYGTEYFPRGVDKDLFQRGRSPASTARDFTVTAGDQLARDEAYAVPGGTETLNRLSRDARVRGAATDADAAAYIHQTINAARGAGPEYSQANALKLARDFRGLRQPAMDRGRGIFDSHTTEDWARYIQSRERAIERARVLADAVGSNANLQHYTQVPGTGHGSVRQTLQDLGMRSTSYLEPTGGNFVQANRIHEGAQAQILQRINARIPAGMPRLTVDDLANVSLDANIVDRFSRIADYYASPEAQGMLVEFLDNLTRMWKSSVLAFPSRFSRDWFSGGVSNYIEVGDAGALTSGYSAAKALQQGDLDELGRIAQRMPQYQGMNARDAAVAFRQEMVEQGLMGGRGIEDLGTQFNSRQMGTGMLDSYVPGARPKTTFFNQATDALFGRTPLPTSTAAYSELGNLQGYRDSTSRFFRELGGSIREGNLHRFNEYLGDSELTDPILRWSAKLGDTTDEINRVAGYAGLMLTGVSPEEAARRIMRAQVDYGSLSKFEREFVRRVVPFWTYNSRIGKYLAEEIWKHPGGAYSRAALRAPEAATSMGGPDEEPYVPKQIKNNVGFSLEPLRGNPLVDPILNALAPPTDGVNSYLNSIELPGTGLINMVNYKQNLDGSPQVFNSVFDSAMGITSRLMHPLLKDGVEMLTGRNLHTGRTLAEYEPTVTKLGRGLGLQPHGTADQLLKLSNYALDFVPHAPRALQTANRLIDTTRVPDASTRVTQSLFNTLTGMKVTPMSEDAARLDASRELTEMLSDSPYIRAFENRFIPKDLLPYASPEDVLLYRLDRQMRKEARDARRASSKERDPFAL